MIKFNRDVFFPIKDKIATKSITKLLPDDDILYHNSLTDFEISDISSIPNLRDESILYLEKDINLDNVNSRNIHIISNILENKNLYENITITKNLNF